MPKSRLCRSRGYSLAEMTVALVVLGFFLKAFFEFKQDLVDESVVSRTVEGFALIDEALYAYRVDKGSWPASMDVLSDYLPNFNNANGVGLPYAIEAESNGITISTELRTKAQQTAVAAEFPVNGQTTGDTLVAIGLPLPGLESAHSQLLHRSGGTMEGDLDMGGNDLTNVGNVQAASVAADSLRAQQGSLEFVASDTASTKCTQSDTHLRVMQKSASENGLVTICGDSTDQKTLPLSSVKVESGQKGSGTFVFAPLGYSIDQCAFSVSGPSIHPGRTGFATSYRAIPSAYFNAWRVFFSQGTRHCRSGCDINDPKYLVDYQMVCSK